MTEHNKEIGIDCVGSPVFSGDPILLNDGKHIGIATDFYRSGDTINNLYYIQIKPAMIHQPVFYGWWFYSDKAKTTSTTNVVVLSQEQFIGGLSRVVATTPKELIHMFCSSHFDILPNREWLSIKKRTFYHNVRQALRGKTVNNITVVQKNKSFSVLKVFTPPNEHGQNMVVDFKISEDYVYDVTVIDINGKYRVLNKNKTDKFTLELIYHILAFSEMVPTLPQKKILTKRFKIEFESLS